MKPLRIPMSMRSGFIHAPCALLSCASDAVVFIISHRIYS
ncbi:hypothetical protein HMPREF9244_00383 [Alloscardovia omnicolens F0580]|uniref:Lipoprotein n=1 Tax=Alloscardovia omnicolens F0580 TaxID=1321816 RepID=U1SHT7_9BIFI|nr:hypothetical protein HMPREF9244_00383 [Alloscardovia omnicolens F0580]